jgi:hypothetical protein
MLWIEMKQKNVQGAPNELQHSRVTPLMAAAMGKRLSCCSLLLCVCDKEAVDAEQLRARDRAGDDEEIKTLLA